MLSEEPLRGIWIDRTGYYRALQQGKDVTLEDFTEHLELELTPLPCWAHLDRATRRNLVLEMIRDIEEETVARHQTKGTVPLGATAVLTCNPHEYPAKLKSSPKPRFHAFTQKAWKEMREAFFYIAAAYREAADQLRQGVIHVAFPENTFPPARPFVEPVWAMSTPAPERLEPG